MPVNVAKLPNEIEEGWVSIYNNRKYDAMKFAKEHPDTDINFKDNYGTDITHILRSKILSNDKEDSIFKILDRRYFLGFLEVDESPTDEFDSFEQLSEEPPTIRIYESANVSPVEKIVVTEHVFLPENFERKTPKYKYENKIPWYSIPIIWAIVALYFFCKGMVYMKRNKYRILTSLLIFLSGIVTWTFCEYLVHRVLISLTRIYPVNDYVDNLNQLWHTHHHHFVTQDKNQFPTLMCLLLLYYSVYKGLKLVSATDWPYLIVSGGLFGNISYDILHHYIYHSDKDSVANNEKLGKYGNEVTH